MNTYPSIRLVYGRRNKKKDNTLKTIEIEIYYNKKRKWISTGVKVRDKNWKNDKHIVGLPNAVDLNIKIETMMDCINNHVRQLMINNATFTWESIDNILHNNEDSFIEFVEQRITQREKHQAYNSIKNYKVFIAALKESNIIKKFSDINRQNIIKYEEWLRARKKYKQSTIAGYHKHLRTFINEAIRMNLISEYPYRAIRIDKGKSEQRRYLTKEELSKLEKANMPSESLMRIRDLFLFQCFTGLSYADVCNFDFNQVIKKGNKYIIHNVRQKTGEDFHLVLLPKAMEILIKYEYKLPIISNQKYNKLLKKVSQIAKISRSLTSHMGRHTYATLCLNYGIRIEVLANMLGHSDIKTTRIYAKLVNQTVEEAYDLLSEKLSDTGEVPEESKTTK